MSRLDDAEIAVREHGWKWVGATPSRRMLLPPEGDKRILWAAMWDENGLPHWLPRYSEGETE